MTETVRACLMAGCWTVPTETSSFCEVHQPAPLRFRSAVRDQHDEQKAWLRLAAQVEREGVNWRRQMEGRLPP